MAHLSFPRTTKIHSLLGLILTLAALQSSAASLTTLLRTTGTEADLNFENLLLYEDGFGPMPPIIDTQGLIGVSGSTNADILLDFGLYQGSATASVTLGGATMGTSTNSDGSMIDSFTINAPGLAGMPGTWTGSLSVSGTGSASQGVPELSGTHNVDAGYNASISVSGNSDSAAGSFRSASDEPFFGDPLPQSLSITVPFTFGVSQILQTSVGVFVQTTTDSSDPVQLLMGNIDLSTTAVWMGFDDVLDEFGNPVTNFAVTSDSGFDWSQPHPSVIPIPTALWLFGSALGLLGWMRARRSE